MNDERYAKENALISKAINFAVEKHSTVNNPDGTIGQKRKGSNLPYIIHPIEVWQILRNNDCSVDVQIAGLLHDTLEDTKQVCCADKLSNCRAQLYDYKQIGAALFDRFNKQSTPELQAWYYKSIVKALAPLKGMKMYDELCEVVKELYGE